MFRCQFCHRPAVLILNTCERCDPALHTAWNKAVNSSIDFETVTPDIAKSYQTVQTRKALGIIPNQGRGLIARISRFISLVRYRISVRNV